MKQRIAVATKGGAAARRDGQRQASSPGMAIQLPRPPSAHGVEYKGRLSHQERPALSRFYIFSRRSTNNLTIPHRTYFPTFLSSSRATAPYLVLAISGGVILYAFAIPIEVSREHLFWLMDSES